MASNFKFVLAQTIVLVFFIYKEYILSVKHWGGINLSIGVNPAVYIHTSMVDGVAAS